MNREIKSQIGWSGMLIFSNSQHFHVSSNIISKRSICIKRVRFLFLLSQVSTKTTSVHILRKVAYKIINLGIVKSVQQ